MKTSSALSRTVYFDGYKLVQPNDFVSYVKVSICERILGETLLREVFLGAVVGMRLEDDAEVCRRLVLEAQKIDSRF